MNKALLRQALDALEDALDDSREVLSDHITKYGENSTYRPYRAIAMRKTVSDGEAAIQALKAELAKPEPAPEAWRSWHDTYGVGYWDTFDEAELNCTEDAEPTELFTKEQL